MWQRYIILNPASQPFQKSRICILQALTEKHKSDTMAAFQFRAKLMAAVLVTFLVVALEAPALFRPYGNNN